VQQLLLWNSNKYYIFWVCICGLMYPACNAHAPYCHLRPARLYNNFRHYHKRHYFRKKLLNIKYVFWFSLQTLFKTFLILRKIKGDVTKNVHWSSCKVHVTLFRFQWKWNILDRFQKNTEISNLMKIRPEGAKLLRA